MSVPPVMFRLLLIPRSLDKVTSYKSHIRSAARGQSRWSGHGFLSSSIPKRTGSSGNMAGGRIDKQTLSASILGADKTLNPYTGLVTIHDVTPMLPIDYNLARTYRYVN